MSKKATKKPKLKKRRPKVKELKTSRVSEEIRRRCLRHYVRGTAVIIRRLIEVDFRTSMKSMDPEDIMYEEEYQELIKAERHLVASYKRFRQVERRMAKTDPMSKYDG